MPIMSDIANRSDETRHLLRSFGYSHLPPHLQAIGEACHGLAEQMIEQLPDGPWLSAGLRKLLAAKDRFLKSAMEKP